MGATCTQAETEGQGRDEEREPSRPNPCYCRTAHRGTDSPICHEVSTEGPMRVPITKNDIADNFTNQPRARSKPRRFVLEHYPLRTLDRKARTTAHHERVHYPLRSLGWNAGGFVHRARLVHKTSTTHRGRRRLFGRRIFSLCVCVCVCVYV